MPSYWLASSSHSDFSVCSVAAAATERQRAEIVRASAGHSFPFWRRAQVWPVKLGAPCLDFQTWETANLNRPSLVPRNRNRRDRVISERCVQAPGCPIPGLKIETRQAAEKLDPEGGGGFNPRVKPTESMWALAPEGRFAQFHPESRVFPQAV